jgi:two-component system, cell cycle sensor histidine kinase DivJ
LSHLASFERPSHWIDQLIPERLEQNPLDRARQRAFILPRLGFAGVTLLAAPVWLFLFGAPTPGETLLFLLAQTPLVSVVTLARSGDLRQAQTVSALGWLAMTAALPGAGVDDPAVAVALLCAALVETALAASPVAAFLIALAGAVFAAFLFVVDGLEARQLAPFAAPILAYVALLVRCAHKAEQFRTDVGAEQTRETRVLAEALGDMVLRLDASGAVADVLGKAHREYSLDRRDLMGRGLFQRVHIADRPAFLKLVSDAAADGAPVAAALRVQVGLEANASGAYAEPVFKDFEARLWRDNETASLVCALRDVTAQTRADSALAAARAESDRAEATKARFLANVSHELRTPLNAIIGFSELLANPDLAPTDPAKQREYAGIVASSGHHLLQVVNTILDMSKIDSGSMQIFPEPFSLPSLADECCDMLQLKADQGGVRLLRDYARERGEIVGDRRACKQILINLLSNAVKFTPAGGRVRIHLAPEGNLLALTVADTGIGVSPADLGRLGDPFFQASATHDRAYEGTGLGLSVVRGLVGLHGGAITIESAPKKGTAVTVRLPLDCRNAGAAPGAAPIETIPRLGADLRHPQEMVKQSA